MKTAEEVARETGPCWGDGIAAPKQCDEVYLCELHGRFAQALTAFRDDGVKEALEDHIAIAHYEEKKIRAEGRKEGREEAAKRAEELEWQEAANEIRTLKEKP